MTIRRLFGAVALTVAVVTTTAARPVAAARMQPPATVSPALDRLAKCVGTNRQLALVMLIDESQSLRETDPLGGRVAGAQAAVKGLTDLVQRSGTTDPLQIDVQIAGFGVDFEESAPWQRIDPADSAPVTSRIDSFGARNNGLDTDYVNALQGALGSVQGHAREMRGDRPYPPCTAVLWFTDGMYDVEDRLTAEQRELGRDNRGESQNKAYATDLDLFVPGQGDATVERGEDVLCAAGGVADQLRATGTTMLGVALTAKIATEDQDFLRRVVVSGCGVRDGIANGQLLTGDLQGLVPFFDEVVAGLSDPTKVEDAQRLTPCPTDQGACPTGTKTFTVDGYLNRFHVLAKVDVPDVAVRLAPPGAPPVDIPKFGGSPGPGDAAVGPTAIKWSWISDKALTIDATSGDPNVNWAGLWAVT
ncbi:MAG: hypothetical protein ACOYOQ_15650, partial [Microthrixaceae bacterium]